jgi:hypothetical protein
MRMACEAWALDGYGAPLSIYLLYAAKVGLYIGAWVLFCQFNAGVDANAGGFDWLMSPVAFQKAVLWSLTFEVLGLGCGSGPLTGRYWPPLAAPLHFLRPGTIKLPLWSSLPLLGRTRRGWLDVALYIALICSAARGLVAPSLSVDLVWPCVVLVAVLGLSDKTLFLAARAEHYWAMLVCFLFVDDWIAGAMVIQVAIWMWAAISKLTAHFPSVVCVMTSNSPVLRAGWMRRAMYRRFPDDLRPSRLARVAAHFGTVLEFGFPILLLLGDGGVLTIVGLGMMLLFHTFITSNVPMGVPIEWNVMVVYGGLFLFGAQTTASPMDIASPWLIAFLAVSAGLVPLIGNLWPERVSFLMAMRYYAGNWGHSIWLFRGDAADKLDSHIKKAAAHPTAQLARFYDEDTVVCLMSKVPAFRAMHLHGRAMQVLIPEAVDDIENYEHADGEIIAGMVLGYNFGEGHLHDHRLLAEVQRACGFASGQLRHIFIESQPLFRPRLRWEIRDARDGVMATGFIEVSELMGRQPWPSAPD